MQSGSSGTSSLQKHCSKEQQPHKAADRTFHVRNLAGRDEIVAGSDQNTLPWPAEKGPSYTKSVACMPTPKISDSPPSTVTSKHESRQPGEQDQRGSSSSARWNTYLGCRSTRIAPSHRTVFLHIPHWRNIISRNSNNKWFVKFYCLLRKILTKKRSQVNVNWTHRSCQFLIRAKLLFWVFAGVFFSLHKVI